MSASIAELEVFAGQTRHARHVATVLYGAAGERALTTGDRAVPEALALHAAATALADAEACLARAKARAEAAARRTRVDEAGHTIARVLASGPMRRDAVLSAIARRQIACVALAELEIAGVVVSWRDGERAMCSLTPAMTGTA